MIRAADNGKAISRGLSYIETALLIITDIIVKGGE
jgi:hypothetical protein